MEERFLIMSKHDEIVLSGVTWRIPILLRRISEAMEVEENNPTPPIEPSKPKHQIHWTYGATGEWLGTLVEETKNHLGVTQKEEFSQVVLRITVSGFTEGKFEAKSIFFKCDPNLVPICKTDTLNECFRLTEQWFRICENKLVLTAKEHRGESTFWWR
jgi:hypothetical protein